MSLTENGNGGVSVSMPVAPIGYGNGYGGGYPVASYPIAYPVAYGNGGGFGDGFGGDWSWIIILFLFAMFGGGFGGFGGGYGAEGAFPWLLASDNNTNAVVSSGFNQAATQSTLSGINSAVTSGFGDVQTALCNGFGNVQTSLCSGFAGVNATVNGAQNAISQQLYTNQLSDLERSYAAQTATMNGFNNVGLQLCQASADNRLATANIGADIAREACATRTSDTQNTQIILNAISDGFKSMREQNYIDKIDAKNDEIAQLRQENLYARGQASQIAQNEQIVNSIYNRLDTCPVGTTPVFGRTPIFTCNNNGCGCGM